MPFDRGSFWALFLAFFLLYSGFRRYVLARNILLLAASYLFYAALDLRFLGLLLFATAATYGLGLLIAYSHYRRVFLIIGVLFHVGILVLFKYLNFFTQGFENLFAFLGSAPDWPLAHLALPLGISFYTFQALGYLIDVYRGQQQPTRNPLTFALFLAFFPKLVAGPIERASHLIPQLESYRPLSGQQFAEGAYLVVWGLVKKFAIADNAALIADNAFHNPSNLAFYDVLAVLAFVLQIYADFSGYSDIAKGLAALLGFDLVWNFQLPFLARSPSDFWRRWHISLSEWFRDYVYIPLGGNRRGSATTVRNLLLTMLLVGLWHGDRWTFVLWGLYQGILLSVHRIAKRLLPKVRVLDRIVSFPPVAILLCFVAMAVGWALFRSDNVSYFWTLVTSMNLHPTDSVTHWYVLLLWSPILVMQTFQIAKRDLLAVPRSPVAVQLAFYLCAFYALMFLPPLLSHEFIYGQF